MKFPRHRGPRKEKKGPKSGVTLLPGSLRNAGTNGPQTIGDPLLGHRGSSLTVHVAAHQTLQKGRTRPPRPHHPVAGRRIAATLLTLCTPKRPSL